MPKTKTQQLTIGGSIETALDGNYSLNIGEVLEEAVRYTSRHFFQFSPAVLLLVLIQFIIGYIALQLQLGDIDSHMEQLLSIAQQGDVQSLNEMDMQFLQSVLASLSTAEISYVVISAPLSAGVALMGMTHAVGLATKTTDMFRGLNFMLSVMLLTIIQIGVMLLVGLLFPFFNYLLLIVFKLAILLSCEKRLSPIKALTLSIKAVMEKPMQVFGLYAIVLLSFVLSWFTFGAGFLFSLPFSYHVIGIVYRNMFGVQLHLTTVEKGALQQTEEKDTEVKEQPTQPSDNGKFDA